MKDRVAVVSGGGAGHEPLHAGYVGMGMLDAACPGQVFTSPTPDQMVEACKAVNGGKGILQIVKNYTGDVMNFQMAADLLRDEGIEVRNIVIDDDVALKRLALHRRTARSWNHSDRREGLRSCRARRL